MRSIDAVMSVPPTSRPNRCGRFRALLGTLWLLLAAAPALSGQTGLKLALVPESTAIVPGQAFRVGLFLQHEPGWHSYWRQPGIVGVPTQIAWELPPGFTAGELEYPGPEPVLMFHIKAQGYRRDVLLQTRMVAPANLRPGERVSLRGRATWMCCGNTCHPGNKVLALELPVARTAEPHPVWAPVFEREHQAYARDSAAWLAEAVEQDMSVTLTLRPVAPAARRFSADELAELRFYTEDGWINSDEAQHFSLLEDGALQAVLTRAEVFLGEGIPDRLPGVLRRARGWLREESWPCLRVAPKIRRLTPLKD